MLTIVTSKESQIRLSAKGRWSHQGQPFTNQSIIRFLHQAIRKDDQGAYYLYNRLRA